MDLGSIKDAFDDAYRSNKIQSGEDVSNLRDPYSKSTSRRSSKKQKKSNPSTSTATQGGLLKDGDDQDTDMDDQPGGFLPPEEDQQAEIAGGFLPDSNQDDRDQPVDKIEIIDPTHLPISSIPDALTNLNLPSNDLTIMSLFAQASEKPESRRRNRVDLVVEKVVSRERFEEIAKILLEARDQDHKQEVEIEVEDEDDEEERIGRRGRPQRTSAIKSKSGIKKSLTKYRDDDMDVDEEESSEEEDEFKGGFINKENRQEIEDEFSDSDDSLSNQKRKGKRKSTTGGSRRSRRSTQNEDDFEDDDQSELSTSQRKQVMDIWEMLINVCGKDVKNESTFKSREELERFRIGKRELMEIVKKVGEKIGEIEIQEMLSEALKLFAPASSSTATRESARNAREADSGMRKVKLKVGQKDDGETVGIDEFAGVLVKAGVV